MLLIIVFSVVFIIFSLSIRIENNGLFIYSRSLYTIPKRNGGEIILSVSLKYLLACNDAFLGYITEK